MERVDDIQLRFYAEHDAQHAWSLACKLMAQELIERRAAKAWIPVSERLPNDGQDVLAWCGFCITAVYKKSNRLGSSTDWKTEDGVNQIFYITHWMPLPEPPA